MTDLSRAARGPLARAACVLLLISAALLVAGVPASRASATQFAHSSQGYLRGIAVGGDGSVFVVRSSDGAYRTGGPDAVLKYAPDGTLLRTFGRQGTLDGEFDVPFDVAVDDEGSFYVVDFFGHRLQKFLSDGQFVWSTPVGDQSTTRIVWDPRGFIWAMETNNGAVAKYKTSDGAPAGRLSIATPMALALRPDGDLWVNTYGSQTLDRRDRDGNFVDSVAGISSNQVATSTTGGGLFVGGSNQMERRSAEGQWLSGLDPGPPLGVPNPPPPGLYTAGIASFDGRVVYATYNVTPGDSRVLRIDSRQAYARLSAPSGPALTGHDVSLDASGSYADLAPIARYEWDLDGNGSYETDSGARPNATTTFADAGRHAVGVRVTSSQGGTATTSESVDVRPAPPSGPTGVSINDGDQFTNDPNVVLTTRWPNFSTTALLSNDGGFAHAQSLPVGASLAWTLDASGPERLPKTVYVRFDDGTQTYQDDIILDQTPPAVTSATLVGSSASSSAARIARSKRRSYSFTLRAQDAVSGVAGLEVTDNKRAPGPVTRYVRKMSFKTAKPHIYVRALDYAGNFSKWRVVAKAKARRRR
jgi:hypothetical protein